MVEERNALDHAAAFDIQAWNNPACQHDLPHLPSRIVALLDLVGLDLFDLLAQCYRKRLDHLNIAPIQLAQMDRVLALSHIHMAEPARDPLLKLAHPAI